MFSFIQCLAQRTALVLLATLLVAYSSSSAVLIDM